MKFIVTKTYLVEADSHMDASANVDYRHDSVVLRDVDVQRANESEDERVERLARG